MFTSRRIKLKMLCLSGFSRETELTVRVYRKSDLLWGVGSWDYGGWKVPTFVGWVGKLETQQKWWCSSKSELEGLRTRRVDGVRSSPKANRLYTQEESMFQFKCEEGKSNIPAQSHQAGRIPSYLVESQPFCSIQAFNWLDKTHTHWRRQWHPTPVLLPGKSHGQRSLVGYSPWGRKESDTTEWLYLHTLGRTICFSHSTDSNVNLIQMHLHRHIPNNVSPCFPAK